MKEEPITPFMQIAWNAGLEGLPPAHPLRFARVTMRRYQDCTFEHSGIVQIIDRMPYTFFVIKTESFHDALPFADGDGRYQVEAEMLPGGSYPIEAGMYELCVNGKPAFDRKRKRFHRLITMP